MITIRDLKVCLEKYPKEGLIIVPGFVIFDDNLVATIPYTTLFGVIINCTTNIEGLLQRINKEDSAIVLLNYNFHKVKHLRILKKENGIFYFHYNET